MIVADRCPDCDLPLATPSDYDVIKQGEGQHLCWRTWNAHVCIRERVDWRARALAAETDNAELLRRLPNFALREMTDQRDALLCQVLDLRQKIRCLSKDRP